MPVDLRANAGNDEGRLAEITWHNEKRAIRDLIPYEVNPRQITNKQAKDLKASLAKFGIADPLIINTDNMIIGGHQRKKILETLLGYDPDYQIDVRVPDRELSIDEARELNVRLNKNVADWDFDILANNFELDDLLDWGFSERDLRLSFSDVMERPELEDMPGDLPGVSTLKLWMDFPSNNRFDIPDLLIDKCTDLPSEILKTWAGPDVSGKDISSDDWFLYTWGSDSTRLLPFGKTILNFYTNDERFDTFWEKTAEYISKILNAGIRYVISPNYSLWHGMARALHIYNVFRSRWVGRYMQEAGLFVIPDVNWSDEESFEYCLLGLPTGAPILSVQLQTIKTQDEINRAVYGLARSVRELQPERLLIYSAKSVGEKVVSLAGVKIPVIFADNRVSIRRDKMDSVRKEVV